MSCCSSLSVTGLPSSNAQTSTIIADLRCNGEVCLASPQSSIKGHSDSFSRTRGSAGNNPDGRLITGRGYAIQPLVPLANNQDISSEALGTSPLTTAPETDTSDVPVIVKGCKEGGKGSCCKPNVDVTSLVSKNGTYSTLPLTITPILTLIG
jgi:hypothetical protein